MNGHEPGESECFGRQPATQKPLADGSTAPRCSRLPPLATPTPRTLCRAKTTSLFTRTQV